MHALTNSKGNFILINRIKNRVLKIHNIQTNRILRFGMVNSINTQLRLKIHPHST